MVPETPASLAAMLALLEREGRAVTQGDFAELPELLARKETLLARLQNEGVTDARALGALKVAAERNGALLHAAERGLRAARHRLLELSRAERGETYDAAGRRSDMMAARPLFERKA